MNSSLLLPFATLYLFFSLMCVSFAEELTPPKVDRVVVKKSNRVMMLMQEEQILKTYRISLGKSPEGHKVKVGDSKTPEGEYLLDWRNPKSKFHLSIHISYPNEQDALQALMLGVRPGGNVMIHGLPKGMAWLGAIHAYIDWTDGCIAVTNEEMEEIWRLVPDGTPIRIES
jgi:murein L,D-transpeptidase YafK